MKAGKAETVDEYLAALSGEKRETLQKLRRTIRSAAPAAEECISYGIPTYKLNGKMLVSFGAAAKHCAFYPGAYPVAANKRDLKTYSLSKGTVRFPVDDPLPATLVRKLVKSRLAEHSRSHA